MPWVTRILQMIPFPGVIGVVVLCLIFGENYPFSNFPMYSSLSSRAELVFVTNAAGEPLEMQPVFGFETWSARKMLKTETRKLEKESPALSEAEVRERAGQFVLHFLLQRIPEPKRSELLAQGVQLHWDKLELQKGHIVREFLPTIQAVPKAVQ